MEVTHLDIVILTLGNKDFPEKEGTDRALKPKKGLPVDGGGIRQGFKNCA